MHRLAEHVGEVELELDADTEEAIFASALEAFAEPVDGGDGRGARHEVDLRGEDRALLLVDWLSELVFLAETERFVPERARDLTLAGAGLRAVLEGRRAAPSHLVKAVTLNRLAFERRGARWHARVVLDV